VIKEKYRRIKKEDGNHRYNNKLVYNLKEGLKGGK
jgi:hypothetical protein